MPPDKHYYTEGSTDNRCIFCGLSPENPCHVKPECVNDECECCDPHGCAAPRLMEQNAILLDASKRMLFFLMSIRAAPGDPLRAIQDQAHGPYREMLQAAIAKAEDSNGR